MRKQLDTLDAWLSHLESIHPLSMDFKLERIRAVLKTLAIEPIAPHVIIVAGTNGKGSTATTTATLFTEQGYKTGLFTSPHINRFNERIRLNLKEADDALIMEAFNAIETARGEITLTYFEFATLAAFYCFKKENVDVAILEVGLGGRLDSTNITRADMALITPIDLDHTHILGDTIEKIAFEKAGVIKEGAIVITSEINPPEPIITQCDKMGATRYSQGDAIAYEILEDGRFTYSLTRNLANNQANPKETIELTLPKLNLLGRHQYQNAVTAISALLLSPFPVDLEKIGSGLSHVSLKGRFQPLKKEGSPDLYLDVTHNRQGARVLKDLIKSYPSKGRVLAVFGMLIDKDPFAVTHELNSHIDHWYLTGIDGERGQTEAALLERIATEIDHRYTLTHDVPSACEKALKDASKDDIIIVFGSFHIVSAGINWLNDYGYHD